MAGRWTFVLVIALACAMVTAQKTDLATTAFRGDITAKGGKPPWQKQDFRMGDRLTITCTEKYEQLATSNPGVLIGQDRNNFYVALDATGTVNVFGMKGLYENQACLVKRGIVLKTGDWVKVTGDEDWWCKPRSRLMCPNRNFEGKIGRLGRFRRKRHRLAWMPPELGFEIFFAFEDKANVNIFKGAYFVKSSEQMAFESYLSVKDRNWDGEISPGEWVTRVHFNNRDLDLHGTGEMESPQFSNIYFKDKEDQTLWGHRESGEISSAFWAGISFTRFDKNLDKKLSRTEFFDFWREEVSAMRDEDDSPDEDEYEGDERRLLNEEEYEEEEEERQIIVP